MRAALTIARKDLRQKIRDRSALILTIIAPLALATLFSSVLSGDQNTFTATYAVADRDGGPIAIGLREGPLAGLTDVGVTITAADTEESARAAVAGGSADVAIIIPPGFSDAIGRGAATEVQIIGSVNRTLATQVARSVVSGFATGVEGVQVAVTVIAAGRGTVPDQAAIGRISAAVLSAPAPVTLAQVTTRDRVAASSTYYAAAMAIMFLFFAVQFGVVSLHAERRAGMLARMLAAPVSPREILLGKVLVSFVLGVVSLAAVIVGSMILMRATWGDPLGLALLVVAAAVAACGIIVLAVGATKNEEQAGGLASIIAMVLAVLGGSFFPLSQAPEILTRLSFLTPHAWFLQGVNDLSSGDGAAIVLPAVAVLVLMGAVTGGLGLALARRTVVAQ